MIDMLRIPGHRHSAQHAHVGRSELLASLATRDALIEEMDHRVKNHLQLLASYARTLARERGETAADVANEIAARLSMVAAIHDALHSTHGKEAIEARDFLARVCTSLSDGEHQIEVDCDEDALLGADELAPIGMIVVEAVCNSLKHGFPHGRRGAVTVAYRERADRRLLVVADEGVGCAPPGAARGSGLKLMSAFAKRLRGTLHINNIPGSGASLVLMLPGRSLAGRPV